MTSESSSSPSSASKLRGYECMTAAQLKELCGSLDKSRSTMEKLLEQLLNEQGKLIGNKAMLQTRIAELEASGSSSETSAGKLLAAFAADLQGARILVRTGSGDAAAGQGETARQTEAAGKLLDVRNIQSNRAGDLVAGTLQQSSHPLVSDNPSKEPSGSFTTPACQAQTSDAKDTMVPATTIASTPSLSQPEELMAKPDSLGGIRLTWFYDESFLEQLADEGDRRLYFEVRQQSEGAGGRLRTRLHTCPCRLPGKGREVGEQSCIIGGCTAGRIYTFSVRARLEVLGQAGDPLASEFCDPVSAIGLGGSGYGPSSMGSLAIPLGGSFAAPSLSMSTTSIGFLSMSSTSVTAVPIKEEVSEALETPARHDFKANENSSDTMPKAFIEPETSVTELSSVPQAKFNQDSASFIKKWLVERGLVSSDKPGNLSTSLPRSSSPLRSQTQSPAKSSTNLPWTYTSNESGAAKATDVLLAPILKGPVEASISSSMSDASSFLQQWMIERKQAKSADAPDGTNGTSSPEQKIRLSQAILSSPSHQLQSAAEDYDVAQENQRMTLNALPQAFTATQSSSSLLAVNNAQQAVAACSESRMLQADSHLTKSTQGPQLHRNQELSPTELQPMMTARPEGTCKNLLETHQLQGRNVPDAPTPAGIPVPPRAQSFSHAPVSEAKPLSNQPQRQQSHMPSACGASSNAPSLIYGGVPRAQFVVPRSESQVDSSSYVAQAPSALQGSCGLHVATGHQVAASVQARRVSAFEMGTTRPLQIPNAQALVAGSNLQTINSLQPRASVAGIPTPVGSQGSYPVLHRASHVPQTGYQGTIGVGACQSASSQNHLTSLYSQPISQNPMQAFPQVQSRQDRYSSGMPFQSAYTALGSQNPFSTHFAVDPSVRFDPPGPEEEPPPRSAPGYERPPPRSAPSLNRGDFQRFNEQPVGTGLDRTQPWRGGSRPDRGSSSVNSRTAQHVLQVRVAENDWRSLTFFSGDDLQRTGSKFTQQNGLKAAFIPGIVTRMQQMISTGQDYACADIIDLI